MKKGAIEWRYYPEGFRDWTRLVGPLPEEFVETYELLCEALYWGVQTRDTWEGGRPKGGYQTGWWFGNAGLLGVKTRADRYLSQTTKALRRWERQGQGKRRTRPQKARGVDLPGARGEGDPTGARGEEA